MLIKCDNKNNENLIEKYIGDNYYKCLYLYLDFGYYNRITQKLKLKQEEYNVSYTISE